MDWQKDRNMFSVPGFSWRVGATILLGVGWLSFVILWLFFWAGSYDVYQNIAIVAVSIIVVLGLLATMWAPWGIRYARDYEGKDLRLRSEWRRFFGWRGIASTIIWAGWLIWLLIWLYYYAVGFNVYQNLAIFIVSLLIAGGVSGAIWATVGRKARW